MLLLGRFCLQNISYWTLQLIKYNLQTNFQIFSISIVWVGGSIITEMLHSRLPRRNWVAQGGKMKHIFCFPTGPSSNMIQLTSDLKIRWNMWTSLNISLLFSAYQKLPYSSFSYRSNIMLEQFKPTLYQTLLQDSRNIEVERI